MERIQNRKWLGILLFGAAFIILVYFIHLLIKNMIDPTYFRRLSNRQPATVVTQSSDKLVLPINRGLEVGRLIVTYRGTKAGAILIDVILLDLDKRTNYRHQIPLKEAKKGFFLSNQRFKMISVNRKNALLSHGKHLVF